MDTETKPVTLVANSSVLEASIQLADWRYPWYPTLSAGVEVVSWLAAVSIGIGVCLLRCGACRTYIITIDVIYYFCYVTWERNKNSRL